MGAKTHALALSITFPAFPSPRLLESVSIVPVKCNEGFHASIKDLEKHYDRVDSHASDNREDISTRNFVTLRKVSSFYLFMCFMIIKFAKRESLYKNKGVYWRVC